MAARVSEEVAKGSKGRRPTLHKVAVRQQASAEPPRKTKAVKRDDGDQGQTAVRHGAKLDDILDDDEEYEAASDEEDDENSPRFVNPFAQIFAKNKLAKETLTVGKLEEHLAPKLEAVYARLKEADAKIDERFGKLND